MASTSCLRQIAASHVGFKTVVLSPSYRKPCRVHLPCGFRGNELNIQANKQTLSRSKTRVAISAEAVAETTEVEAEVVPAEETSIVEVEQSEQPPRTGKVKKTKGLKNIMQVLHQRAVDAASEGKNIPDIRTGDIVQLRVEVPENKKRVSLLRGIVIAKHNGGIHTTFRIRRVVAGVGVEMVFPLYSPNIKEIKVVNSRKVRRAKLYYLRDKIARLSSC